MQIHLGNATSNGPPIVYLVPVGEGNAATPGASLPMLAEPVSGESELLPAAPSVGWFPDRAPWQHYSAALGSQPGLGLAARCPWRTTDACSPPASTLPAATVEYTGSFTAADLGAPLAGQPLSALLDLFDVRGWLGVQ